MIKNRKECLQKADPVHDVIFFLSKCGGGGGGRGWGTEQKSSITSNLVLPAYPGLENQEAASG